MHYERVAQVYQKTNIATMPATEYILQLLQEGLKVVQYCQTEACDDRRESIRKAQDLLFELMAMTNHDHPEGKRLFQFYVYLNQCLVQARLHEDEEALQKVAHAFQELIDSWTAVKASRRQVDRV